MPANEAVVPFAEGEVTRLRREFKWVASFAEAAAFCELLTQNGCIQPPITQITSVYFDRPGLPLSARAMAHPDDCLKLRTKEYFPNRSGLEGHLVFEAKRERDGLTEKQRLWLPRAKLRATLRSGSGLPPGVLEGGPILPVLAVAYERRIFQNAADWRVTVDQAITYHAISTELALGDEGLRRALLGTPVAAEERVVVEVKHHGNKLPGWLAELRARAGRFSKFAEGMARQGG